ILMSDKTVDTHVWTLEHIKKAVEKGLIVMFIDRDPALDSAISIVFLKTYSAYCIFHIIQNLSKNLKAKLDINWDNFIKQFYKYHNSLYKLLFKERWSKLLNDFSIAKNYFLYILDPKYCSWARVYLYKIFITDVESIARVESYNWIIK
ncbi:35126_t:CDS:1, partial [Racocetra persica]